MVVLLSHMLFIDNLYLQTDDEQIRFRLTLLHFQYAMQMKDFDLAFELLAIIKSQLSESLKCIEDKALPVLQPIPPVNQKSRPKDPKKKIKNIPTIDRDLNHNISGNENISKKTQNKGHRENAIGLKGVLVRSRTIRKTKTDNFNFSISFFSKDTSV